MNNADKPAMPNQLHKNKAMNGLTKLEYFAALAMQGFCASPDFCQESPERTAAAAVAQADALLAELGS